MHPPAVGEEPNLDPEQLKRKVRRAMGKPLLRKMLSASGLLVAGGAAIPLGEHFVLIGLLFLGASLWEIRGGVRRRAAVVEYLTILDNCIWSVRRVSVASEKTDPRDDTVLVRIHSDFQPYVEQTTVALLLSDPAWLMYLAGEPELLVAESSQISGWVVVVDTSFVAFSTVASPAPLFA